MVTLLGCRSRMASVQHLIFRGSRLVHVLVFILVWELVGKVPGLTIYCWRCLIVSLFFFGFVVSWRLESGLANWDNSKVGWYLMLLPPIKLVRLMRQLCLANWENSNSLDGGGTKTTFLVLNYFLDHLVPLICPFVPLISPFNLSLCPFNLS